MQYLIWHNEVRGTINAGTLEQFNYFSKTYGIDEASAVLSTFSAEEFDVYEKVARKLQAVRLDQKQDSLVLA